MKTIPVILLPECVPDEKLEILMECSYGSDGWPENGFAFLVHKDTIIEVLEDVPGCETFLEEIKNLDSKVVVLCPDIAEYKEF